ncbi:hypothetical protein DL95DRAFT_403433 [Leptodontidium sp. 2 PMI_412]|nr:hypothetical protein DL95DRAFT_403433 [Leptodontidium sp. 2 PMI_412]
MDLSRPGTRRSSVTEAAPRVHLVLDCVVQLVGEYSGEGQEAVFLHPKYEEVNDREYAETGRRRDPKRGVFSDGSRDQNDPESKARREVALPVALALAQDHSTSTPSSFPVSPAPTAPTNNQPNLVLATVGDVIVTLSNNSDGENVLSSLGYISSSIRPHCLCRLLSSPVMSYSLPPVPPPIPMRFLSSPAPLTVDPQFGSAANGWW